MTAAFSCAAVLFDMDGTLIDSAASIERVWTEFAVGRGLPVAEVLAALPGRWAVVTSAPGEVARARLAAAGLPVPAVLVAEESVTRGKPDPEGFARAAGELGVAPSACVVFEDAEVGLRAGRAAGARCVGVGTAPPSSSAHAWVSDLRGLAVGRDTAGLLELRLPVAAELGEMS